jgi:hypothetical protein
MEYFYYDLLTWLMLFFNGLPFCLLCLPVALKKYSFVFAPIIGYCDMIISSYYFEGSCDENRKSNRAAGFNFNACL